MTEIVKIMYWANGTWCYANEYDDLEFSHLSDDFGYLNVDSGTDYTVIDAMVDRAIGGELQ